MRIEILIDNEEPLIYPLDRPKIVVGSHETCDIVLKHKSISRKHAVITSRDDKFYVSDQGSTNGTFINEKQLIPGNSAEFTSFFPVRLGDNVLMTLLSDDEARDLGPESELNSQVSAGYTEKPETTRMISLSDMQKTSTATLTKKRTETVAKRKSVQKAKPEPKKAKSHSNLTTGLIGLFLVGGVAYYQFSSNKAAQESAVVAEKKLPPPPVVPDSAPIKRVGETELPTAEQLLATFKDPKCTQNIEKYLCVTLPAIFQGQWGTVLQNKNIVIYADGKKYGDDAAFYLKKPLPIEEGGTKVENDHYKSDLSLMATVLWMNENIPLEVVKFEGMNDYTFTLAFVDTSKEAPGLVAAAVFVPESLLRLRPKIQPKNFSEAKKTGAFEFSFALEYLRFL